MSAFRDATPVHRSDQGRMNETKRVHGNVGEMEVEYGAEFLKTGKHLGQLLVTPLHRSTIDAWISRSTLKPTDLVILSTVAFEASEYPPQMVLLYLPVIRSRMQQNNICSLLKARSHHLTHLLYRLRVPSSMTVVGHITTMLSAFVFNIDLSFTL